ncbi:MAG: hypothetical protein U5K37_10805 [Natrialbaceae archaeon]|nr:hypothetical protein [Natrialbaceae archaeon]
MERRKFIIGTGALAAGTTAAIGTGAFSYVRADRDVEIEVVPDEDAYLGLEETSEYADGTSTGTLSLNWAGGSGQNGDGLNDDADSRFDDVFSITNQGTNPVRISFHAGTGIGGMPDEVTWYYQKSTQSKQFTNARQLHDTASMNLPVLNPGESLSVHVIFWLRDSGADPADLENLDTLGIVAEEP